MTWSRYTLPVMVPGALGLLTCAEPINTPGEYQWSLRVTLGSLQLSTLGTISGNARGPPTAMHHGPVSLSAGEAATWGTR